MMKGGGTGWALQRRAKRKGKLKEQRQWTPAKQQWRRARRWQLGAGARAGSHRQQGGAGVSGGAGKSAQPSRGKCSVGAPRASLSDIFGYVVPQSPDAKVHYALGRESLLCGTRRWPDAVQVDSMAAALEISFAFCDACFAKLDGDSQQQVVASLKEVAGSAPSLSVSGAATEGDVGAEVQDPMSEPPHVAADSVAGSTLKRRMRERVYSKGRAPIGVPVVDRVWSVWMQRQCPRVGWPFQRLIWRLRGAATWTRIRPRRVVAGLREACKPSRCSAACLWIGGNSIGASHCGWCTHLC